ncbi:MAG: FecR family protein [Terriglobales bacterium]
MAKRQWCWGLLALLIAAAAWGQSRVRIVGFSFISRDVQVQRPAQPAWKPALLNAPVVEKEIIRTGNNSAAEVQLECGSALRLAPNSELAFDQLTLSPKGVPVTGVTLKRGEAFFTVQKDDARDLSVHLPAGTLSLPHGGAQLRLDVSSGQPASIEVLHGQVLVRWAGQSQKVKSKRRFLFLSGIGLRLVSLLKPDAWAKWSNGRDAAYRRALLAQRPPLSPMAPATAVSRPWMSPGGIVLGQGSPLGEICHHCDSADTIRALDPTPLPSTGPQSEIPQRRVPFCAD